MMTRRVPAVLASMLAMVAGCDELASVSVGECGNLVVEPGEQCDGPDGCGTEGLAACRWTCSPGLTGCPGELACGSAGVCVASAGTFVPYELSPRYEWPADHVVVGDLDGDRRDDLVGVGDSVRVRFGAPETPLLASSEKRIRPPTGAAAFGELDDQPGLDVVFPTADGVFTLLSRGRDLEVVPYASAQALPDDSAGTCVPSPGWAACRELDLDRDGRADRVGFVADRDNLEIELGRGALPPAEVTFDTIDIVTDLASGDFDGDGFGDVAFSTRSVDGVDVETVQALYGAPQPAGFTVVQVTAALGISGIAARDVDSPPDGLDDLAVQRDSGSSSGVAVHLGDSARDLSAPFRLDGARSELDVPYAVVAGEFVGGAGSGIDVMAYARNPQEPGRTFLWWLRGVGSAQLVIGAIDPVDRAQLDFVTGQWKVGDLVIDASDLANGPDEVIGLSPVAPGCAGPALTAAVPSARFTSEDLLRSACLAVQGPGWAPALVGLLDSEEGRAVTLATRGQGWWLGEADRLDQATSDRQLDGGVVPLDRDCRDPQLWHQTPDVATYVSWMCDDEEVVMLRQARDGVAATEPLLTVPRGATHLVGDFNGDGLSDLVIRQGRELAVVLQCSTDMVGTVTGC